MFLGSVLVFIALRSQPKSVLSATQYFSSGILIAVIGQELIPDLEKAAEGITGSVAIVSGFAAGVIMMYSIEHFSEEGEEGESQSQTAAAGSAIEVPRVQNAEQIDRQLEASAPRRDIENAAETRATPGNEANDVALTGARPERSRGNSFPVEGVAREFDNSRQTSPFTSGTYRRQISLGMAKSTIVDVARSNATLDAQIDPFEGAPAPKRIPWAMTIPIFIDAIMDGMLIGLMSATTAHGAVLLAVATAVEMAFLGITFGALVMHCGWRKWFLALLMPLTLTLSGLLGAVSAHAVADIFEVGITAFGIAALLFLACNELLKEASENASAWQSCWLFVGFLVIIMLERYMPEVHEGASAVS